LWLLKNGKGFSFPEFFFPFIVVTLFCIVKFIYVLVSLAGVPAKDTKTYKKGREMFVSLAGAPVLAKLTNISRKGWGVVAYGAVREDFLKLWCFVPCLRQGTKHHNGKREVCRGRASARMRLVRAPEFAPTV